MGFRDLHLLPASLFRAVPEGAESLFVAFAPYRWAKSPCNKGKVTVSNYYPVSNEFHSKLSRLKEVLIKQGVFACENKTVFEKEAASYCGGMFGKNTLFYHKEFGSAVFIATLFTGVKAEHMPKERAKLSEICGGCRICEEICPVKALPARNMAEDCLRARMYKKPLAASDAEHIYQLFGCEICQKYCPMNKDIPEGESILFDIDRLFYDRKDLEELIGKNYARKMTVLQQLIAYAANTEYSACRELILQYENEPLLKEVCEYYKAKVLT